MFPVRSQLQKALHKQSSHCYLRTIIAVPPRGPELQAPPFRFVPLTFLRNHVASPDDPRVRHAQA